jgi:hypothetical protein
VLVIQHPVKIIKEADMNRKTEDDMLYCILRSRIENVLKTPSNVPYWYGIDIKSKQFANAQHIFSGLSHKKSLSYFMDCSKYWRYDVDGKYLIKEKYKNDVKEYMLELLHLYYTESQQMTFVIAVRQYILNNKEVKR